MKNKRIPNGSGPSRKTPMSRARFVGKPSDKKNVKSSAAAPSASIGSSSIVPSSRVAPSAASTTSWGAVAAWYDKLLGAEAGTYQKDVVLPALIRLMALQPGEEVADLACGQGFFVAAYSAAGAKVKGADISPELIERAKVNAPSAEFFVAPANKVAPITDGWANQVSIVLAIQNIEDVRGTLAECARILKPGGRLHIVMNHPAFRIARRSSWGWDKDGKQYRRLDGYLTESRAEIEMHPGADASIKTWSFHRPFQYYVKALVRAGFLVSNLEEWISNKVSDSGPRAPEENRARREFPLFMYIEAVKK